MDAVEAFKNMPLLFFTDAYTFVSHSDRHFMLIALHPYFDWLPCRTIFDGIADQVVQYLLYPPFIAVHDDLIIACDEIDLVLGVDILFKHMLHQLDNIHVFLVFDLELFTANPRDIHHLLDQVI